MDREFENFLSLTLHWLDTIFKNPYGVKGYVGLMITNNEADLIELTIEIYKDYIKEISNKNLKLIDFINDKLRWLSIGKRFTVNPREYRKTSASPNSLKYVTSLAEAARDHGYNDMANELLALVRQMKDDEGI